MSNLQDTYQFNNNNNDIHMASISTQKQKKTKLNSIYQSGPTNRDQFQTLFSATDKLNNQLLELQAKIYQLEQENNNLKSIIGLSNINPYYQINSIDENQLLNLYNDKITQFIQCVNTNN